MGTAIVVRSSTDLHSLLSSPELLQLRRISLGTVRHQGQRPRKYLSGGLTLTAERRAQIAARLAEIVAVTTSDASEANQKARLALIASLMMAYPVAGSSGEEAGKARAQAHLHALDDIPPWAVAEAIKRWHKGQFAGEHNYRFAPAPAELREGCMAILQAGKQAAAHLADLLNASTMEEAMDPAFSPEVATSDTGKVVSIAVRRM